MSNYTNNKKMLIADLLKNPLKFWKFKRGINFFLDDFYEEQERTSKLRVKLLGLDVTLDGFRNNQEKTEKEIEYLKNEVIELKHTIAGLRKELEGKENACNCKK